MNVTVTHILIAVLWGCSATSTQTSKPKISDVPIETSSAHVADRPVPIAFFSSGSIEPHRFDKVEAHSLIQKLQKDENMRLLLTGHADQHGGDTLNEDLALRRAAAVAMELEKLGADTRQLVIRSFGEAQTQSDDNSKQLERDARRVSALLVVAGDAL